MPNGIMIFVEDDFSHPIYAEPESEEIDPDLFSAICEKLTEALEDEGDPRGTSKLGDTRYGWSLHLKSGVSFVAFADGVTGRRLNDYLASVSQRYFDEVDDVQSPDKDGVEDVVVDVIPPWEDDEDDED